MAPQVFSRCSQGPEQAGAALFAQAVVVAPASQNLAVVKRSVEDSGGHHGITAVGRPGENSGKPDDPADTFGIHNTIQIYRNGLAP